jgi:UDP-GlcNAc:undecaprenyl-phosphate/decaprenyl-phosphate GlcNAc-1-phosphate transferase
LTRAWRRALSLLKTIEDQFHSRRNAELIKNLKKVIPNDSGSTAIGLGIAFLALDFLRSSPPTTSTLAFPALVAGLPLIDAALAVIRRLLGRGSPLYGDRRHFYDLLSALGWSPIWVALTCYAITAALGITGWRGMHNESAAYSATAVFSLGLVVFAAIRLGALRGADNKRRTQRMRAPSVNREIPEA